MSFQLLNLKIKLVFLESSFEVLHTAIFEHACVITSEFLEFYFSVFVYDFVSHIILVINNWRWSIRFSYMRSAFILFQLLFCKLLNHFFNVVWIGQNFQTSEAWILEHLFIGKLCTFENFIIDFSAIHADCPEITSLLYSISSLNFPRAAISFFTLLSWSLILRTCNWWQCRFVAQFTTIFWLLLKYLGSPKRRRWSFILYQSFIIFINLKAHQIRSWSFIIEAQSRRITLRSTHRFRFYSWIWPDSFCVDHKYMDVCV